MDFKKTLIATTAICAVGGIGMTTADAASKPKLGISGYYELFMGAATGDRTGVTASGTPTYGRTTEGTFSIIHYGEIRFKAEGKTDNGMKWGVYFEDVQNDADVAGAKKSSDETNIWLSGSWGKLELGGQDGAHDKVYAGPEKLMHISPGMIDAFANTSTLADEKMSSHDTSDDTKITYFTPRISGFQAGYSWIPNSFEDGNCTSGVGDPRGSLGGNSRCDQSAHEGSISYKGKISNGKIDASWGFGYLPTSNNEQGHELNWRAGVTYSQGPWSVAAGYRDFNNDGDGPVHHDATAWEIGAAYSGGRWEVAVLYYDANYQRSGGLSDIDYSTMGVTGAYNLGGGLTVSAALYRFDADYGSSTPADDTDGTVGILALGARF